jgi:4'-phosphopantetheinyl transferase
MRLGSREAHVWLVALDVQADRRDRLARALSTDERERAGRYRTPEARERFVVTRGTLRELLGRYGGLAPEELRFAYPCACGRPACTPSQRKPRLDHRTPVPPLRFNVSHTDGLAVVAVALEREVGVDVERIRAGTETGAVAERVLGAGEAAALRALPEQRRAEAFYRLWTRREAHVKARGDGLAPATDRDSGRWRLHDVPVPTGYLAALAVEGGEHDVRTAWWPPGSGGP